MNTHTKPGRPALLLAMAVVAAISVGGLTGHASAQPADPTKKEALKPPTPAKPDEPPAVMNYLTMVVMFALIAGASLIPSKRGHQD